MNFKDKIVWITGASSGIGKALAVELSNRGAKIILSSRNKEKLRELANSINSIHTDRALVMPLDLSDSNSIIEAYKLVEKQFNKIDILVNNGGISQRALVEETPIDIDRRVFEINFFGAIHLTKLTLPMLVKSGNAHIVVLSSVVGKFGFPLRSAYSASKHALHGYFETVRAELGNKNIKVNIICPGRVKTDISLNAITSNGTRHNVMDEGQAKGISAEKCARIILQAIKHNKKEVIIGFKESIMVFVRKFMPYFYYKIVSKVKPT